MTDEQKTKEQLIHELAKLRQRVAELETLVLDDKYRAADAEWVREEEALKESEERYRSLFDRVPVGLYRTTPEGQVLDVNLALVEMLGYPDRETLLTLNTADGYVNPEDRTRWQALMDHEGVVRDFEVQWRRHDGTALWVKDTARSARDADGRVLYYEGSVEDIADRKGVEEQLKLSKLIVESANDALFIKDLQSRYILVNNKVLELFGVIPREKIVGKSDKELLPPEDALHNIRDDQEVFETGKQKDFVKKNTIAGKGYWFHVTKIPLRGDEGKIIGLIGVARDVTERKRVKEALEESEEKYRTLVEKAPIGLCNVDLRGKVTYVNERFEKVSGYSRDEVVGKNGFELGMFPDETLKLFAEQMKSRLEGKPARTVETRFKCKDGRWIWVQIEAGIIQERGSPVGFQLASRDITEHKRMDEALRESEERYRSLTDDVLNSSAVGIFILDSDFRIVWVNQAMEGYFGLRSYEIVGKDKRQLIRERVKDIFEDPEGFAEKVLSTYDDNTYVEDFGCHVLPDGEREERWLEHWSQPIRSGLYGGGRIEHYYDITERVRAEEALRESKRQLENQERFITSILDSIPTSLVVIDRSQRVVSANRNFLEKTRREEQTTLGCKIEEVFPQVLLEYTRLDQKVQEVFRTGQLVEGGRLAYRGPGLPTRYYYYRLIPLSLSLGKEGGEVENVMLLMDDVTEREKLGEEVRRAERHLASVVDSANDLVVSMDPEGRILTWNKAAERTSGFDIEEVRGQYLPDLCVEESQQEMESWLGHWAKGQFTKKRKEIHLRTQRGKEVPISWSGSRMLDDGRHIVGLVAVGRDLTERKRLEAQLIQSAKLTSLGVMAGGIAHEIRNPLAVSSAAAQLLLERPDDEKLREQATEKIRSGIQRASYIIENLLKFARPPEERMVSVDVSEVLEETLSLLANQLRVQRVGLRKDIAPDLPPVVGNKSLLQQVFSNMILNACNAMPDGGSLTITARVNSDNQVVIAFADTGCGVPEEDLSKIFDPFFTTMPVGKGIGLGLSISYSIVQQHQGTIEVESQVGQGSTFTVRLLGT